LWRSLTVRKTKVLIKKKYSFPIFVGNSLGKDEQVTVSANRKKRDTLLIECQNIKHGQLQHQSLPKPNVRKLPLPHPTLAKIDDTATIRRGKQKVFTSFG